MCFDTVLFPHSPFHVFLASFKMWNGELGNGTILGNEFGERFWGTIFFGGTILGNDLGE